MAWNGIGIGWPNASASAEPPVVMGYFQINQACNGEIFDGVTSQLVNTSLYTSGNSIFGTFSGGVIIYKAVTLGAIVFSPGGTIFEISGPSYTTCPVYYQIDQRCDGGDIKNMTTIPVSNGTYNEGEYLYSTNLNTIVLIGENQNTPGGQQITVTGEAYEACQVSYDIYDCIQDQPYTTGYYNTGTFGNGDRVYTPSGNYGYVNTWVEPQEGDTDTEAFPIGYVDYRCNDCNVTFSFQLGGGEEENTFNILLFATESLGEVNFESSTNTLFVTVQYEIELEESEGGGTINRYGYVQFQINEYAVEAGSLNAYLGEEYAFNVPAGDWNIIGTNIYVTDMNVGNIALGPYDTGWDEDNKYITTYGNAWTFYYPT